MATDFPLRPLLEQAQSRMDDAARELGELIARENADSEKLEALKGYRAEYHARFIELMNTGIGPDTMRNFSAFMAKIDEAIRLQQEQVDSRRDLTRAGQQNWLDRRNRVKAIDTLSQRHQQQELRREYKQEQKLADEHSARQFRIDRQD